MQRHIAVAAMLTITKNQLDAAIKNLNKAIELNPELAEAYNNRGNAYTQNGKYDLAIEDYDKAIKLNPTFAHAYSNRGNTYGEKGNFTQSIKDLTKAIRLNPSDAAFHFNLGNTYQESGQIDQAITSYTEAIQLKFDRAGAHYSRGNAHLSKGDYRRAIEDYITETQLNPNFTNAYVNLGVAYRAVNELDLAIESYTVMIALDPNSRATYEAYNNQGLVYLDKGDFNLAIQDFEKAIKLQPALVPGYVNRAAAYLWRNKEHLAIEDYTKVIELNPELVMAYYSRGTAWLSLREWEKAKTDLMTAKDKGLDITAAFHNTYGNVAAFEQKHGVQLPANIVTIMTSEVEPYDADTYNARGIDYGEKGEFDKAIEAFTKAIELNPKAPGAYYNRGLVYREQGKFREAIDDFNMAINLKPDTPLVYFVRGIVYRSLLIFDKAIQDFNTVINLKPDYVEAYYNRGETYYNQGEVDLAIENYNTVIKLKPKFTAAYVNRGLAYHSKNDVERAIADYNKAIELSPDHPGAYYSRGNAYNHIGDFDLAIEDYTKAVQLSPDDTLIYNNRGIAYFKKGEVKRAIEDYTKAITLKPDEGDVYYNRGEAWLHLQEWEKAKGDLTTAKEMGLDIVAAFRNDYRNTAAFEQKHQVKLPKDIIALVRQGFRHRYPIEEKVLGADGKPLESSEVLDLLQRFRDAGPPLGEYLKVSPSFGIETVPTEVFVVDRKTRDQLVAEHPSSTDILKPFLQGQDIKRWHVESQDQWLIFTYRGIEINNYPAILKYLEKYKELLSKRSDTHEWYELQASLEEAAHFAQPKLVCPNLYNTQTFAVETEGLYCGYTCYVIPTAEKWLGGLLNTLPVEWFYSQVSKQLDGSKLEARSEYIKQIPVPDINATQKDLVRKLVDYLIYLQKQPTTNSKDLTHARDFMVLRYFEWIVKGLVYEFYMPDLLQSASRDIFKHLIAEQLPEVDEIQGDKMSVFRSLYARLHDREHPVRVNLFFQDSLRPIRIIEDKW